MTGDADAWDVALASLRLANRLVDAIQDAVHRAGFVDARPVHGFAFVRLAAGDLTTGELAEHLGVSKQAAAQLVERMVRDGFVERVQHPSDRRARLLRLTPRARVVTDIAQTAAIREVAAWRTELSGPDRKRFERALLTLTRTLKSVRPTW